MWKRVITDVEINGGEGKLLPQPNRVAARGILRNPSGEVALLRMSNGCAKLPGGGLEPGETPEAAFLREILEETGQKAARPVRLGTIEEHKYQNGFFQLSYCLLADWAKAACTPFLTVSEQRLGLALFWEEPQSALLRMEKDFCQAEDYGLRFMMLREREILFHYLDFLAKGEKEEQ